MPPNLILEFETFACETDNQIIFKLGPIETNGAFYIFIRR